jgi:hypothetical protein
MLQRIFRPGSSSPANVRPFISSIGEPLYLHMHRKLCEALIIRLVAGSSSSGSNVGQFAGKVFHCELEKGSCQT